MLRNENFYTKIIIDGETLESYERNVREFQIQVCGGDANSPNSEVILKDATLPAEKKNDFVYKAKGNFIFGNAQIGSYYWFRSRIVNDAGNSSWTAWQSERAGDTTINLSFSSPAVVNTSSAVTFRVTASNVEEDFSHFEWKYLTESANIYDNPVNDKPVQPANPSANAVPDFKTENLDDISISFNESRILWYHVWVRALDKSGNKAPSTNNNWYYVGCGKLKEINLQVDQDPYPPDNTDYIVPSFIENAI